jgi:hypothetical protein
MRAGVGEQQPGTPGARKKPKGRRNLLASNLPRCLVEILDEELEAKGCRRIGFEDSAQLMFRRGGFAVLVKRVARYEVIKDGAATVVTVPSPGDLVPAGAVAHVDRGPLGGVEVRARRSALSPRARCGRPGRALGSRDDEPVHGARGQHAGRDHRAGDVGRRHRPRAGHLDGRHRRPDSACQDRRERPGAGVQEGTLLHGGGRLRRDPVCVCRAPQQRER